jgi:mono/diheme cytochrome c family protein
MKRSFKWAIGAVVLLAAGGLLAFLYFIPPLTSVPVEDFVKGVDAGAPSLEGITDPAERLLAERGKYIVTTSDCIGCHQTPGGQGPDPSKFLAGGMTFVNATDGKVVTRNLTPDRDTGLGGISDADIKRVLRSGVHRSGRQFSPTLMPWPGFSSWTDEDLHAVVVYLRHLAPVPHAIPDQVPGVALPAGVAEQAFAGRDAGTAPGK